MIKLFFLLLLIDTLAYVAETFAHAWVLTETRRTIRHDVPVATILMSAVMIGLNAVVLLLVPWTGILGNEEQILLCAGRESFSQLVPDIISVLSGSLVASMGIRWWVHDLGLNYLRRLPWDYIGDRSDDALTDKVLQAALSAGSPPWMTRAVGSLILFIISFLIMSI